MQLCRLYGIYYKSANNAATMISFTYNALTNATVASVIATVEDDTEVAVPRRITRSQSTRLNLAATFEGFVPANYPDAWRDRDLD